MKIYNFHIVKFFFSIIKFSIELYAKYRTFFLLITHSLENQHYIFEKDNAICM